MAIDRLKITDDPSYAQDLAQRRGNNTMTNDDRLAIEGLEEIWADFGCPPEVSVPGDVVLQSAQKLGERTRLDNLGPDELRARSIEIRTLLGQAAMLREKKLITAAVHHQILDILCGAMPIRSTEKTNEAASDTPFQQ